MLEAFLNEGVGMRTRPDIGRGMDGLFRVLISHSHSSFGYLQTACATAR